VKYCMSLMGLIEEVYRLPLCSPSDSHKQILKEVMKGQGLI
jgi:4-hydroxy-tetrahydrodipicolinate synthase